MNKTYKIFKSALKRVDYQFEDDNSENEIALNTKDKIGIKEINESSAVLSVERKLIFEGLKNVYLDVAYDVSLSYAKAMDKKKFIADIKKGLPLLGEVYSEISLIIAQITDKSPFGAIISPPMHDEKEIEIV